MRPDRREVAAVAQANWSDRPYLGWLALFASGGTLVCCALPILLVSMGFGAVAASLNYNIPGLIFLAENKAWTLSLSALLLLLLAWVIWRPGQSCPTDPKLAAYCEKAKKWNRRIFHFSVTIWAIGFFFSYLLLPLRQFLDY
jgi:mercuric ion transport protein